MINLDRFRDVDLVIDKANDNFIEKQWISSGDKEGRTLTVMLTNGGIVGELTGATVSLLWTNKANGLTDETAFVLKDKATSTFVIEYPTHMLTPGTVVAQIRIWYEGKVVTTKPFEITVSGIAGQMAGVVKQQEFGLLTTVLADANLFRSDINQLDVAKADRRWVEATFSTIQTQFTSTFFDLASLQAAFPNGTTGVYLVMSENALYEWKNNQWSFREPYVAGAIEVRDGVVSTDKTNFVLPDLNNVNLFDKYSTNNLVGKFYNEQGNINNSDIYSTTHKIDAVIGDFFVLGTISGIASTYGACFDSRGRWLGTITKTNNQWQVPNGLTDVDHVRFSYISNQHQELMVIKNHNLPSEYIEFINNLEKNVKVTRHNVKDLDKWEFSTKNVDFVQEEYTVNIFDKDDKDIVTGKVINENGIWQTITGYSMTGYMPVSPNDVITRNTNGYGHVYDSNFNRIAYVPQNPENKLIIPGTQTIKYLRMAFVTNVQEELMVVVNSSLPSSYVPYVHKKLATNIKISKSQIIDNELELDKVFLIGDSISTKNYASMPFWDLINREGSEVIITANASSGARITKTTDRTDSLADRYMLVDASYDKVIIFMGTNDAANNLEIGDNDSTDVNTLKGSLNVAINYWLDNYPKLKIGVITPIQRNTNLHGTLQTYTDAIIDMCQKYGINVLNGMENSMYLTNQNVRDTLAPDGLHPNNDGHKILKNRFKNFIINL